MSERISALEIAIGFECGLYDRGDVVDWVASEVIAGACVEGPLLELCTLAHLRGDEIARELHALASEEVEPVPAARVKLACLGLMVEADRIDLSAALDHRWFLTAEGLTEQECASMEHLEYGYELASWGTHGTVDQVRADFLAFTSQYRHLLAGVR